MTEVPKIVHDRLRAASLGRALSGQESLERAHPDADRLTAFAEHTLSVTERESVLEHLSLCGECRDVIALALPAAEIPVERDRAQAIAFPTKGARTWLSALTAPSLRWAAVAAGVVIIAATFVVHSGRVNRAQLTSINSQLATKASPSPQPSSAMTQLQTDQSIAMLETNKVPKPAMPASKKLNPRPAVRPAPHAESPMMMAGNKSASDPSNKALDALAKRDANETVEVAAAISATQGEASSASDNTLMAQNDTPPVIKSKPVVGAETSQVSASPAAPLPQQGRSMMSMAGVAGRASQAKATPAATNVTWAITGGVLQRSRDGGLTWQNALHADQTLLCYASREEEVWTGGEGGILFHSADKGLTWVAVQPSVKTGQLTSDITHIEMSSRFDLVVSAGSNEIWRSADGGKTWEKN